MSVEKEGVHSQRETTSVEKEPAQTETTATEKDSSPVQKPSYRLTGRPTRRYQKDWLTGDIRGWTELISVGDLHTQSLNLFAVTSQAPRGHQRQADSISSDPRQKHASL